MIKTFTICSLIILIITIGANAQPTLTSGCLPKVNDVYTIQPCDGSILTEGPAGANQTWNFSSLTDSGAVITYNVVDPATTPNASDFTSSTFCMTDGTNYFYGKNNGNLHEFTGEKKTDRLLKLSIPKTILSFPMAYNTALADSFFGTGMDNLSYILQTGNIYVTADGYGTLITPTKTFNNAVRIKQREVYYEDAGSIDRFHSYITTYNWYVDGYAYPVMHITLDTTVYLGDTWRSVSVNYSTDPATGMNAVTPSFSVAIFPNPSSEKIQVSSSEKISGIRVTTLLGQTLINSPVNYKPGNPTELNIAELPSGIYLCTVTTPVGVLTRKIIKE